MKHLTEEAVNCIPDIPMEDTSHGNVRNCDHATITDRCHSIGDEAREVTLTMMVMLQMRQCRSMPVYHWFFEL